LSAAVGDVRELDGRARIAVHLRGLPGCATDADTPGPITLDRMDQPATLECTGAAANATSASSLLPADDIRSLVCDPAAMAAQLVADGSKAGAYQLRCSLTATQSVLGRCLPP
jgi:hypothetical protein